ncbi:nucleoside triphosphate pyrophosphohydrolase [Leptothoe kymatousa]|uniref:Nucleoside triphosphate pyrophosphohydrolase n=1 Tax=Leptothoe kymatousa TAU-MAC 1615 TaxID=2364775 RepID=A0ABS5Y899_9CYAN|nr:nucleoside triphosphate pyrophosphohydrolase [Leptothoe kymatousa]MBT9313801.1 nucleoside triphosphate pyrophosphohydrolase [Leptothoe kymatousa TAU-MAC 1615]
MNVSPLHVWAIIRLLPKMQRAVVNRFRQRAEAENCLQVLRRSSPQNEYTLVYLPPGEEEANVLIRRDYNQLVRDRMPEILEIQNMRYAVEEMKQAEYCQALWQLLGTQIQVAVQTVDDELLKELADILEIVDAISAVHSIQRHQMLACQMQRRLERGAFERRLKLLWTEQ